MLKLKTDEISFFKLIVKILSGIDEEERIKYYKEVKKGTLKSSLNQIEALVRFYCKFSRKTLIILLKVLTQNNNLWSILYKNIALCINSNHDMAVYLRI